MTESIAPRDDFIYRVPTTLQGPQIRADTPDWRRPWTQHVMGYPRFASFISNDEDRSTTIYRRFERLAARNLLYLETELQELESTSDQLDASSKIDPDLASSMQSFEELNMLARLGRDTPDSEVQVPNRDMRTPQTRKKVRVDERDWFLSEAAKARLNVAARIRVVLREYYEFLKLESDILALNSPDKRTLKGVRRVFKNEVNGEEHAPMISGKMEMHLDDDKDLCVLAPPAEGDRLTRLLEGRFAFLFRTRTPEGVTETVSHQRVATVVSIISALAAIAFLLGAVLGLYFISNPTIQLALLSCLTIAFAAVLSLLTSAKRQDVFAATAAYAAVLVVFISGNLGTGCDCPLS